MQTKTNKPHKNGAALLVVLIIVMAVTVISLGFLARSDVELACGDNMILKTQMDYLAESGLQHARGMILNPQDVAAEYWTGALSQQLVAGSDDYYDVAVNKLGECNYQITSTAYRLNGATQLARSMLAAELRLDPVIAFWSGGNATITQQVIINGDAYCGGDLSGQGYVYGDVFASGSVTVANVQGDRNQAVAQPPVPWPGLIISDYTTSYLMYGMGPYPVQQIATGNYEGLNLSPNAGNPAGVYYCNGNLGLIDDAHITGMLVVRNDLRINEDVSVTIAAVKNFPALLVGGELRIEDSNDPNGTAHISITGLAQVDQRIDMRDKTGSRMDVFGALYIAADGIRNSTGCTVAVTAVPNKAAIEIWPAPGTCTRWSPAAGGLFKYIARL